MKARLTRSGPLRVHRTADDDLSIVANVTPGRWRGHFRPVLSGMRALMGPGTVNAIMPVIDDIGLDGSDADGNLGGVPTLSLSLGPNARLRSWLCLSVTVKAGDIGEIDPNDRSAVTIVHVNDLTPYIQNGLSLDNAGKGLHPLAMIIWGDSKTPRFLDRNVYFNQRHSFQVGSADGKVKAWHLFEPIA